MIADAFSAPLLLQLFFAAIYLSTVAALYVALMGHPPGVWAERVSRCVTDAPLLCGFGGTIASLYMSFNGNGGNFNLEEAFGNALASTIYGVSASILGEACVAIAMRRRT